jgi:hypothetical protein
MPEKRRAHPWEADDGGGSPALSRESSGSGERPLPIPLRTPGAPPSPSTLRSLLAAIPRRAPSEDGDPPPMQVVTRPREDSVATLRPPSPPPVDVPTPVPAPVSSSSAEEIGLKQAIAGLHSLWLAGRQARGATSDTDAFVQLVREAIERR